MLTVDYNGGKFLIRDASLSYPEFRATSDFLGSVGIWWKKDFRAWVASAKQMNELLQWCVKKNFLISLSQDAEEAYSNYLDETFRPCTEFMRGKIDIEKLSSFLRDGYEYNPLQLQGIIFSLTRSNSLNADEQGLGKSLMALAKIWSDLDSGFVDGYIVLVMSGLSWHFVFESIKFSSYLSEDDFIICSNENKRTIFTDAVGKKVIIIPHHLWAEAFFYAGKQVNNVGRKTSLQNVRWSSVSTDIKSLWGKRDIGIVVDESQAFKNPNAIKTRALLASAKQFKTKLLTSATPNINAFEDIYTQIRFLDPSIIPMEYNTFKIWISRQIGNTYSRSKIVSYNEKRLREIKNSLSLYVIKRSKSDLDGFNYKINNYVRYFRLSPDQATLYNALKDIEILKVRKEHKDKISIFNITSYFPYTLQVLDNPSLLRGKLEDKTLSKIIDRWTLDNDPRIVFLDAFIDDYIHNQGKKIVIFDCHPLTLDQLEERYKKYNPLKIHGRMPEKDREFYRKSVEQKFNTDDNYKILLLSTYTSRSGISVNVGSDCIIFLNPPLNSEAYSQARERIHRVNNTRDSHVYSLLFFNTFHVIQYQRNVQRDKFNSNYLNKKLSENDIAQLLRGQI